MSEEASKVWSSVYDTSHVRLHRNDPIPFALGKRLGGGGVGQVNVTSIGNVPLALKRIFTKHLTEAVLAEVKIMRQLTEGRHHHIVQLIGSYERRQGSEFELGLLIWPVASCDLASFLLEVDCLANWIAHKRASTPYTTREEEDAEYAIETLADLSSYNETADSTLHSLTQLNQLYTETLERLGTSIGCIAHAVQWLHDRKIRHKDLKPSQILLSPDGLWLTDFGLSMDTSDMTQSTTVGGNVTTLKYLAPERASRQPCGRPEDIFGLGCIFLEIGYQLARLHDDQGISHAPWFTQGWRFSDIAINAHDYFPSTIKYWYFPLHSLGNTINRMLCPDSSMRPVIQDIIALLRSSTNEFFGNCCREDTISHAFDAYALDSDGHKNSFKSKHVSRSQAINYSAFGSSLDPVLNDNDSVNHPATTQSHTSNQFMPPHLPPSLNVQCSSSLHESSYENQGASHHASLRLSTFNPNAASVQSSKWKDLETVPDKSAFLPHPSPRPSTALVWPDSFEETQPSPLLSEQTDPQSFQRLDLLTDQYGLPLPMPQGFIIEPNTNQSFTPQHNSPTLRTIPLPSYEEPLQADWTTLPESFAQQQNPIDFVPPSLRAAIEPPKLEFNNDVLPDIMSTPDWCKCSK